MTTSARSSAGTNAASSGLPSPLVALTVLPAAQRPTISAYASLPNGQFLLQISGTAAELFL